MSAAGARGTSPSRYARSRATRVGQAVIPIENGGLRAWGRVSDAGGAAYSKRLVFAVWYRQCGRCGLVLAKHHLIPSSDHQDPPHILTHHGAVDSSLAGHAGKR
jgi:hypothetical protein|eukprot:COSAG01_NODE_8667_length_2703_cov_43.714670_4_plen_104_part_00